MEQVKTAKEVKGIYTKIVIPKGTILNVLEDHVTKVLVKYNERFWFLDNAQAKRIPAR